jgi:Putative restriction endonuclease
MRALKLLAALVMLPSEQADKNRGHGWLEKQATSHFKTGEPQSRRSAPCAKTDPPAQHSAHLQPLSAALCTGMIGRSLRGWCAGHDWTWLELHQRTFGTDVLQCPAESDGRYAPTTPPTNSPKARLMQFGLPLHAEPADTVGRSGNSQEMLKQLSRAPLVDWRAIDHVVVLPLGSWRSARAMVDARGDHSGSRMAYCAGVFEIMSPSWNHQFIKTNLARLLEGWALTEGIDLQGAGSWTVESPKTEVLVEPDECYLIGPRGARKLPDLAIEVRWTGFVRSARSALLPTVDLKRLAKHASMEDQSKAIRSFLKLKR